MLVVHVAVEMGPGAEARTTAWVRALEGAFVVASMVALDGMVSQSRC